MSSINRVSIPELMDGRYFFIPAYQRGYRWTSEQVKALLRDLFTYAKGVKHDDNNVVEGDYYCLQPIVAREITDSEEKESLNIDQDKQAWEIIDGQQRLTTIFILYRYLMIQNGIDDDKLMADYNGQEVYHIKYATRGNSEIFLETGLWQTPPGEADNIDFHHMHEALQVIDEWINNDGKALCDRYRMQPNVAKIREVFWSLLNAQKGYTSNVGTVQFLWYELDADKDAILEFRDTNTNQIRLTNAELIKALFLRTLQNVHEQVQLERANQWESVENTLQDNTFWAFLNKRGQDLPNRIDLLFKLRYQLESLKERPDEVEECLKDCENNLKKKDFLFNYFNDKFDGKTDSDLSKAINDEWQEIMTIFHTLEDWYDDVICYNLIGMLSQFDDSRLASFYFMFDSMKETDSRDTFKAWLKEQIRNKFDGISYDDEGKLIVRYGNRQVFNILLMLNVNHLNKQAEGSDDLGDLGSIYKFPFDVLQNDWDIEHIDSFTTNSLKKEEDMKKWVEVALDDLTISDDRRQEIESLMNGGSIDQFKRAIAILKEEAGEEDMTEDEKNNISNLTLLDSSTNRSYGNSLFVTKRKRIIERTRSGQYVPVTTSFVFMKLFDESGTSRSIWSGKDMEKYHDYICEELKDYLPQIEQSND